MMRNVMTKAWMILSGILLPYCPMAQFTADDAPTRFNGFGSFQLVSGESNIVNAALLNSHGLKFSTNKRIEGSVFLNPEWQAGFIRLKNGAVVDSIPMRFNALSHELHILDGEQEYFINDHYREFSYPETVNGRQVMLMFRNGYPPVKNFTAKTFYQYLGGTDLQLLKKITKQLQENRSLDGQIYYRIAEETVYYVYNRVNKSMTEVRKGMQQLQSDFPLIRQQIAAYCGDNKQNCKTETGLIELFSSARLDDEGSIKESKKPF